MFNLVSTMKGTHLKWMEMDVERGIDYSGEKRADGKGGPFVEREK